jgi:hypothetical protein
MCLLPSQGWPGGYCVYVCSTPMDCGATAQCTSDPMFGFGARCLRACNADGSCDRAGYACRQAAFPQAFRVCRPAG